MKAVLRIEVELVESASLRDLEELYTRVEETLTDNAFVERTDDAKFEFVPVRITGTKPPHG